MIARAADVAFFAVKFNVIAQAAKTSAEETLRNVAFSTYLAHGYKAVSENTPEHFIHFYVNLPIVGVYVRDSIS